MFYKWLPWSILHEAEQWLTNIGKNKSDLDKMRTARVFLVVYCVCQQTWYRPLGTKPLPEPTLPICQRDHKEELTVLKRNMETPISPKLQLQMLSTACWSLYPVRIVSMIKIVCPRSSVLSIFSDVDVWQVLLLFFSNKMYHKHS